MKQIIKLIFLVTILLYQPLFAGSNPTTPSLTEIVNDDAVRVGVDCGYYQIKSQNNSELSGTFISAGVQVALYHDFGAVGNFRFGTEFPDITIPTFAEIDVGLMYAITGSLHLTHRSLLLKNKKVADIDGYPTGGIGAEALFVQYFFRTPTDSVPFTGVAGAIFYDLPSIERYGFRFGIRMDLISSGVQTLTPIQLFAGAFFWL